MKIIKSDIGNSIVSVLVGAGILSAILAASLSFFNDLNKSLNALKIQSMRDQLSIELSQQIRQLGSLEESLQLTTNQQLKQCLTSDSQNCDVTTWSDFDLVANGGQVIAGSAVKYDANGAVCSSSTSNCPFEVKSQFKAVCTSGQTSCDQALAIEIQIIIQGSSTLKSPLKTRIIRSTLGYPFSTVIYAQSPAWQFQCDTTVKAMGYVECPPGTFVVGCARDNSNNFGYGDDWVTQKEGAPAADIANWVNLNLIPPGSTGYGANAAMPQGGCRVGYKCNSPISNDLQYTRAICVSVQSAQ